jgi:hypothetical protein
MNKIPGLVAHADWSVAPAKRWLALAMLDARSYRAQLPQPAGNPQALLGWLRSLAGPEGSVLLGVDFPIGLPLAYAKQAGVDDFIALLPELGHGPWRDFYRVAERRDEISLRRPFYPQRAGGTEQSHLLHALNVPSIDALRRQCDQARGGRRAAAPIFWTLGGQQVGKAAISGWRDLLAPSLAAANGELALWPFAGPLAEILRPGATVVAETYPTECYRHLGVRFARPRAGRSSGKRVQAERAANAPTLLRWADEAGVDLAPGLRSDIETGFGARADGEDRFDAVGRGIDPPGLAAVRRRRRAEGRRAGRTDSGPGPAGGTICFPAQLAAGDGVPASLGRGAHQPRRRLVKLSLVRPSRCGRSPDRASRAWLGQETGHSDIELGKL